MAEKSRWRTSSTAPGTCPGTQTSNRKSQTTPMTWPSTPHIKELVQDSSDKENTREEEEATAEAERAETFWTRCGFYARRRALTMDYCWALREDTVRVKTAAARVLHLYSFSFLFYRRSVQICWSSQKTMKLLFFHVLMAFVAVAQVFCEDPKEEADYWTNSNQIQVITCCPFLIQ